MRKGINKALSCVMTLVLAVGLCPAPALANTMTGANAEALTVASSVTTQDDTDTALKYKYGDANVELKDGDYTLYGAYASLGMFGLKKADVQTRTAQPTAVISNGSATLTITGGKSYDKIALASLNDITVGSEANYGTLSETSRVFNGSPSIDGSAYTFKINLAMSELKNAIASETGLNFVVHNKSKNAWYKASAQPYFAFDALDFGSVKLLPTNEEAMFKVVSASVESEVADSNPTYGNQQYYLVFALNSTGYKKVFPGTLSECVSLKSSNDSRIINSSATLVNEEYYSGSTLTQKYDQSHEQFKMPLTMVDADGDGLYDRAFTDCFVAIGSKSSTYRRADVDLKNGTVTFGNYQGSAPVVLSSDVVSLEQNGELYISGYPKMENTSATLESDKALLSSNCSNEFTARVTMALSDKAATYDKVTINTYISTNEGSTAVSFDGTPTDSEAIAIDPETGVLVLPLVNKYEYYSQIKDGTDATIKMHVSDSANYAEAGTWVERAVKIDHAANTVTISGASLTPVAPKAKNPIEATAKDLSMTFQTTAKALGNPLAVSKQQGDVTYAVSGSSYFTIDAKSGALTAKASTPANTYSLTVTATAAGDSNYESGSVSKAVKVTVGKAANGIAATAKDLSMTFQKSAKTLANPLTVSSAQGTVTYAVAGSKYFTINSSTGAITAKKSTPAGAYTLTVTATAGGDANHASGSAAKTVKVTVAKAKQSVKAAKTYSVKLSKVKKAKQTIAVKFTSTSGGKVTYKAAKTAGGKVSIAKNGKVTVKKGTKKGKYTLKVTTTAAAKGNYAKTTVKNVKLTVKVG